MDTELKDERGNSWADLVVLVILAALVSWYCLDAWNASSQILNLILILPVTVLTLALCLVQFCLQFVKPSSEGTDGSIEGVLPVMALFAGFILTLPWLGFDGGSFLFLGSFLWLHGERRWTWILGYSLSFASAASLFFGAMLPYPMPMLLFPS